MINSESVVICSGDSFTSGDELAGDLLIPNYTNNLSENIGPNSEQMTKLRKQLRGLESLMTVNEKFEYFQKRKLHAWPGHLQRLIGCEVLNVSDDGLSNHEIAHRAIETFNKKLKTNVDPTKIIVLLMLSSPNRLGLSQQDDDWGGVYNYQSFMSSFPEFNPPEIRESVKYWFEHSTDYNMLWETFCYIQGAKTYIEGYGSKVVILDSCLFGLFIEGYDDPKQTHNYISDLMDIKLNISDVGFEKVGFNTKLPGGHLAESVHAAFAKELIQIL